MRPAGPAAAIVPSSAADGQAYGPPPCVTARAPVPSGRMSQTSPLRWNTSVSARAAAGARSSAARAAAAAVRSIAADATASAAAVGRQDDELQGGVEAERGRVDHEVIQVRVAHVGAVEVPGVRLAGVVGVGLLALGRLAVDP